MILAALLLCAQGVWISDGQISRLPNSGPEWVALKADADSFRASPGITIVDQDDDGDSEAMAAALVWKRTGDNTYRQAVQAGLIACIGTEDDDFPGENNTSLELSRNLCALAIAADLIEWTNPADENAFKSWLGTVRSFMRDDGRSIISTHEDRPNNWGTHAGASRVAIAVYLGDTAEVARCAQIFRGYLGDRASYSGFDYGELSWQQNPALPVGINRPGRLGGVMPDDQRRCGTFPEDLGCQSNYAYEALQGVLAQAIILRGNGYPDVWTWSNHAIGRAAWWLDRENAQPPSASVNGSDDREASWVLNKVYPVLALPQVSPAPHGKSVGYYDWTTKAGRWPR